MVDASPSDGGSAGAGLGRHEGEPEKGAHVESNDVLQVGYPEASKSCGGGDGDDGDGVEEDVAMDPAVWGNLGQFINLEEMVFARLPLHDFFQSRIVCKAWNVLAGNRRFLDRFSGPPFLKPYFILYGQLMGCHHVVLMHDVKLAGWVLKPLPQFAFRNNMTRVGGFNMFSVAEGFVYNKGIQNLIPGSVFNIHTKALHQLPSIYDALTKMPCIRFSEIAVDKRSCSYKLFVAVGYHNMKIYVYDSAEGKWTLKSAVLDGHFESDRYQRCGVSAHCNGVLYIKCIRRWLQPTLVAYDFQHDVWTSHPLAPHQQHTNANLTGLGEWEGVLYDVTGYDESLICVWKFEHSSQEWHEVDRMPSNLLKWLMPLTCSIYSSLRTNFCEKYILIRKSSWASQCPARFVLYDMALKTWERLEVSKNWTCDQNH